MSDPNDESNEDEFEIVLEIVHPAYDDITTDKDFMLMQLSGISDNTLLRLNWDSAVPFPGQELTVIGFGDVGDYELPDILQEVTVNAIPNSDCGMSKGPGFITYADAITPAMLCAADQGEDSCQGDSGGPIILAGNSSEQDVQVGVVSWYVERNNSTPSSLWFCVESYAMSISPQGCELCRPSFSGRVCAGEPRNAVDPNRDLSAFRESPRLLAMPGRRPANGTTHRYPSHRTANRSADCIRVGTSSRFLG
jgi:hypothetical protein